jgi:hypothetical protein
MADQLDPVLEARLRDALHAEADAVPFTLRADTIRRVGAERRRARNTQRYTLYAAAAVVLVAVAGLALSFAMRSTSIVAASPTPAPSAAVTPDSVGLAPASLLQASLSEVGLGTATITAEHVQGGSGTATQTWDAGTFPTTQVHGAVTCAGSGVTLGVGDGTTMTSSTPITCDVLVNEFSLPGKSGGATTHLMVQAAADVRWRIAAAGKNDLPSVDDLRVSAGLDATIVAQGGFLASGAPASQHLGPLGTIGALRFVGACLGTVQLAFAATGQPPASGSTAGAFPCDGAIHQIGLQRDPADVAAVDLVVSVNADSEWVGIVVAGGRAGSPTPAPSTPAGLPSDAELLAFAPPGAVEIDRVALGTAQQQTSATLAGLANRTAVGVVTACTGANDTVTISLLDANGNESPLGDVGPFACDGKPTMYTWTTAHDTTGATSVKVGYGAATNWTAILVDISRAPQDPAASPPAATELPALVGGPAAMGVKVGAAEQVPALTTNATTTFADIHAKGAWQVLFACIGGSPTIAGTNASNTNKTAPVAAVCDGTIRSYTWIRTASESDITLVEVDGPAGTQWRAAAYDATPVLAPTAHTAPTVACGKPDLSTPNPPVATLYQGVTAIGTVGYFSTSWNKTYVDGVPTVPTPAHGASSGPFTLRLAGDVCATSWTATYTPAGTFGNATSQPYGLLVSQPFEQGADSTTTKNRENRIDLAGLPSGDWVLEVTLTFKDGDATGVVRVHVP